MMLLQEIVFDTKDYQKENLYPFTQTRDVQDIRIGIFTLREKWKALSEKYRIVIPDSNAGNKGVKVPVNLIPSKTLLEQQPQNVLRFPWEILIKNEAAIRDDFELITEGRTSQKLSSTNKAIAEQNIFVEDGAVVEYSIVNASAGPVYIGKNAEIMEGCMIRGPVAVCKGAVVKMGTRVYGATTIGPYCTVGGEIKNSVFIGFSNKAHDGYLGDSVIGEWCNLGAGTSNSNLKNTAGEIRVWNEYQKKLLSAGIKCGLFMGDYSRTALNTSFNSGTVVGVACNVIFNGFAPKKIDNFSWGEEIYEFKKALAHIDNWKKLKGHSLSEKEKKILSDIYQKNKNA